MGETGAFVQHSVTDESGDMEGWPVSLAEAMASGLPIISTRHAGIVDQVTEGVSGFLVDEGEWEQMAVRMIRLVEDAELRVRMGRAARERAKTFDAAGQVKKLEQVLLDARAHR